MKINLYSFYNLLIALPVTVALAGGSAEAQQLGLTNSNYAGTHGLYSNPAAIADSRHGFYLSLFSVEAGVLNNYLRYDAPFSLYTLVKDDLELADEYLREELNGETKFATAGMEFRGPSFMLQLSPKHSIAFTSRVRGSFQVDNLSEELARLYKVQEDEADDVLNKPYTNSTMNLNANAYSELGLTYARVLLNKESHFLKGGLTVKRLAGGYSAYMHIEDADFMVEERPVENTALTEDIVVFDNINAKYGYVTEDALGEMETSDMLKLLSGRDTPGKGWGADIGFTYEYRPNQEEYRYMMDGEEFVDEESNKYKYRIGVSLLDIGGINYDLTNAVNAYDIQKTNKELKLNDFSTAEDTEEFAAIINEGLDVTAADRSTSFRSGLPTALNLSVDYNLVGPIYLNSTWMQNLRGKNTIGMKQNSLVALIPRFEFKKFEASFPVVLQHNYDVLTFGTMIRFANFFIGSDNIAGVFNIGDTYGASVYAGVTLLPILNRNLKDRDGDGVSDKKDQCKKVPGTLELMGCPEESPTGAAEENSTASLMLHTPGL